MSHLWNIVWSVFWAFAFVSYLIALFSVVGDLFRDRRLNGWLKALWFVFLVFVPFLTVLVYLIARGRGMSERQAAQVKRTQEDTDDYIRNVAGWSPSDEILKAKSLRDNGTITQQEYEAIKQRAIAA